MMTKHQDSNRTAAARRRDRDRTIARKAKRQLRMAAPVPEWRPTVEASAWASYTRAEVTL